MSEPRILLMGVAGCGKSTLADRLGRELGIGIIEGDDHHSAANQAKMRQGIALDDADRLPWLDTLAALLARHEGGAVLTCSALKRSYRERIRRAVPTLRVVFLDIAPEAARTRVAKRPAHMFPPSLVRSQFEALESPVDEPNVLRVDALGSQRVQLDSVIAWLGHVSTTASR